MGTQITITTDDAALAADLISLINSVGRGALDSTTVEQTPAPAKKAAAKKAAAPKPDPVVEPEEEEEPEAEADEDIVGGDTEYTMADAVARATELVQASKAAEVKAALADLGVAKVSHLKADQIGEFMSAVDGV